MYTSFADELKELRFGALVECYEARRQFTVGSRWLYLGRALCVTHVDIEQWIVVVHLQYALDSGEIRDLEMPFRRAQVLLQAVAT